MEVGERSVVRWQVEGRLSKECAIHIRSGESVDFSGSRPQPLARHQRISFSAQLQLRAHCMGLLRDSGQVANKYKCSGPDDTGRYCFGVVLEKERMGEACIEASGNL